MNPAIGGDSIRELTVLAMNNEVYFSLVAYFIFSVDPFAIVLFRCFGV